MTNFLSSKTVIMWKLSEFTWNRFWRLYNYNCTIWHFSTHWKARFLYIFVLLKGWNWPINKIEIPKNGKNCRFITLRFSKIHVKSWMTEEFSFHTVIWQHILFYEFECTFWVCTVNCNKVDFRSHWAAGGLSTQLLHA